MIRINQNIIDYSTILKDYNNSKTSRNIITKLGISEEEYRYNSLEELDFELKVRRETVKAAIMLNNSDFGFEVFDKSRCNPKYWERTQLGGFKLKKEVNPNEAVNDIYLNSSKYAIECSTAIVIVFLKALVDSLNVELYNQLFPDIHLYNWKYLDSDLGIRTYSDIKDYLPGDCRYFKNPEVNPKTMEWQGENAIQIDDDRYYGHDLGIHDGDSIIRFLNQHRKAHSQKSAYLMETATRLDYKYLFKVQE